MPLKTSFFLPDELSEIGLLEVGKNVLISRKASIYSPEKIKIGNNVRIDDFCILSGNITLGSYIHMGAYSALYGSEGIIMEDFSNLSSRISIYTDCDDFVGDSLYGPTVPSKYRISKKGRVVLKRHVIVGSTVVILSGCTLEEGAAIGSFSLVNRNCKAWKVYVGIPAKEKADRRREGILKLEKKFLESIEGN